MVGALSIIRFRTAVKDVRDATYIFWAIAAGIGCGVSQYALIVIGSAFLLLFLIITRKGFTSCNKLLVVQGKPDCLHKTEAAVDTFFAGKVHVSMRNVTENSFELVYSIGEGILYKAAKENQMDISEKLIKIDGVKRVSIVDQKDELSQKKGCLTERCCYEKDKTYPFMYSDDNSSLWNIHCGKFCCKVRK